MKEESTEDQDAEESTLKVRTGPKKNRFHINTLKSLGNRKDRAKHAAALLNAIVFKHMSLLEACEAVGISDTTAHKILKHPSTRSELQRLSSVIRVNAIARVNRAIGSDDERNAILAADKAWKMVESLEEKQGTSTAPVIDMTALVSSVASNLLAGAMLGIRSTLQENSRSPAIGTDEIQGVSTSMGNERSSSEALSADDEYVDPEQLNIPNEE